jgi:hypothetical protein
MSQALIEIVHNSPTLETRGLAKRLHPDVVHREWGGMNTYKSRAGVFFFSFRNHRLNAIRLFRACFNQQSYVVVRTAHPVGIRSPTSKFNDEFSRSLRVCTTHYRNTAKHRPNKTIGANPMKRLIPLFFAFVLYALSLNANAGAYGQFKILGLGTPPMSQPYIVIFTAYVGNGYRESDCAQTDWWWPAGTTHTWWVDRSDKALYAVLLLAAATNGDMFFSGDVDVKPFGLGARCRIDLGATH